MKHARSLVYLKSPVNITFLIVGGEYLIREIVFKLTKRPITSKNKLTLSGAYPTFSFYSG